MFCGPGSHLSFWRSFNGECENKNNSFLKMCWLWLILPERVTNDHSKVRGCICVSGLQGEHLPPAEVERPSAGLQRVSRLLSGSGPIHAGLHLETWPVLRQRERSKLPRRHDGKQAPEDLQGRNRSVQHQVWRWRLTHFFCLWLIV